MHSKNFTSKDQFQVPEAARKRVPDSEHLTRMRAHIVNAHENKAFVK